MLVKRGIRMYVFLALAVVALSALLFVSCGKEKFAVDYCGQKDLFKGAKDSYAAGTKVVLYYDLIATDTDYTFYLDDEPMNGVSYSDSKGFKIEFVMPDHPVKLEWSARNSMTYIEPEPQMLVDFYCADTATAEGGGYYEYVLLGVPNGWDLSLEVYTRDADSPTEHCAIYYVPYEAVDRCYAIIEENDLAGWNDLEDAVCIDGAKVVCRFMWAGEQIRVSTEHMPQDGHGVLMRIGGVIAEYITDEYFVSESSNTSDGTYDPDEPIMDEDTVIEE